MYTVRDVIFALLMAEREEMMDGWLDGQVKEEEALRREMEEWKQSSKDGWGKPTVNGERGNHSDGEAATFICMCPVASRCGAGCLRAGQSNACLCEYSEE